MIRPIPLINFAVLVILMIFVLTVRSHAAEDRQFQEIAAEILAGLNAAKAGQLPALSGYGAPTIAIRPFGEDDSVIERDVANDYNRRLFAALQRQANGRFDFVSRQSVERLAKDIKLSGISDDEAAKRIADLKISSRADVLIVGDIRQVNDATVLSYQALSVETARVFASSMPRNMTQRGASQSTPVHRPVEGFSRIVAETESLLEDMGYNPGPVDGLMTAQTRTALSAYQSDSALPVNGRMTRRVVENMRRDTR